MAKAPECLNREETQQVFYEIGALSEEELLKRYKTLAWGYINQSELEAVEGVLKRLAETRKLGPILDVGCGTGRLLIPLSRRYEVAGLDFSRSFLDQLKADEPQIPIYFGEATQLPFKEESYSTVLCVRLVQHLTHKEQDAFFKEASRVLKKNGILIVLNYNALGFLTLYKKLCQGPVGRAWPRWPLKKWNWQVDDYHFAWELSALFRRHGFNIVEQIALTPGEPDLDRFLGLDSFLGKRARGFLSFYYGFLMRLNPWGMKFPFSFLFSRVLVVGEKA